MDAEFAIQHGADGLVVSNHGGHEDVSGWGTIEPLPKAVTGVAGKVPRDRASWHVRPLLVRARGVETVPEPLRRELQVIMAKTAAASISKICLDSFVPRS